MTLSPTSTADIIPVPARTEPAKGIAKSINYFAVSKGNYPNHIVKALTARGNWERKDEEDWHEGIDFYWRQVNLGFQGYDKIDKRLKANPSPFLFNHFEVIRGITTKTNLVKSLRTYYETNEAAKQVGYTLFDTTPTTYVI